LIVTNLVYTSTIIPSSGFRSRWSLIVARAGGERYLAASDGVVSGGRDRGRDAAAGKSPFEMDWAGRTAEDYPPLADLADLIDGRVECRDAIGAFDRSREQPVCGRYAGRFVYRGSGKSLEARNRPARLMAVPRAFDAVPPIPRQERVVRVASPGFANCPGTPRRSLKFPAPRVDILAGS
jgi:hypothetical protein